MAQLPLALPAGIFAAAIACALLHDAVKVALFRRLKIAWSAPIGAGAGVNWRRVCRLCARVRQLLPLRSRLPRPDAAAAQTRSADGRDAVGGRRGGDGRRPA